MELGTGHIRQDIGLAFNSFVFSASQRFLFHAIVSVRFIVYSNPLSAGIKPNMPAACPRHVAGQVRIQILYSSLRRCQVISGMPLTESQDATGNRSAKASCPAACCWHCREHLSRALAVDVFPISPHLLWAITANECIFKTELKSDYTELTYTH